MKILFLCQNTTEANAWYRSSGIAKNLIEKTGYDIEIINWQQLKMDWSIIIQFDVILLQRPFTKEALSLSLYIKSCGVKLWVDYDDNLLDVNPENKVYMFYNKQETKNNIINIIKEADAVSVTTEYLKMAYSKFSNKIHVIPNAYNEIVTRPKPKKREPIVFWRGSDSHIYNLWSHGSSINKAIEKFPKWRFDFMGYYPWMLSQNKGFIEGSDIMIYFKTIANLAPSVFHAPLVMDNFNICRSNISYLEASFAGAISIIPEWWGELPGALTYSNPTDYYEAIKSVCRGDVNIVKKNKLAWDYTYDNFRLDKINKLRIKLLKNL